MSDRLVFLIWAEQADLYANRVRTSALADRVEILTAKPDEHPDAGTLGRVEALYAKFLPEGILKAMPRLRWLQAEAAGVDRFLRRGDLRDDLLLTSGRGIHSMQMPDTILGAIFHTTKPFKLLADQQRRKEWRRINPASVGGQTLAIVGLGAIGAVLARKAAALDMRVLGVNRSGAQVEHVDRVEPFGRHEALIADADHVVLLVPLTPETKGIIDAAWLAAMKPTAWLHNFSRGEMVVDDDLIAATSAGAIAGAVLDAFRHEPLDPGHPFWTAPNIIVLPHIGGLHPDRDRFIGDLILDNLGRFVAGGTPTGVVDRSLGY